MALHGLLQNYYMKKNANKGSTILIITNHIKIEKITVSYKCVVFVLIWNPSKVQYTPYVTGSISLTGNNHSIQQLSAIVHPVATLCFPSPVKTLAASTICTRSFLVVGCESPPAVFLFRLDTLQIANETEGARKQMWDEGEQLLNNMKYQIIYPTAQRPNPNLIIHNGMKSKFDSNIENKHQIQIGGENHLEASIHSTIENPTHKTQTPHPTLVWIDFVDRKLTFGTVDQRRVILRNIKDLPSLPLAVAPIPTLHCIAVLCREYPQYPYFGKILNSDDKFETKDFFNEDGKGQNNRKNQKPIYDKQNSIDYENSKSLVGLGLDLANQYFHESIPERDAKGDLFIDLAADWYIECHSKHFKDYRPKRLPPYKYNAPKITLCYSPKTKFCISYPHSLSPLNVMKALENQNPRLSATKKQYMYVANN
ncbi:MAG: hypothetical protein EZS28_034533, partial [Streblomastix strix]